MTLTALDDESLFPARLHPVCRNTLSLFLYLTRIVAS